LACLHAENRGRIGLIAALISVVCIGAMTTAGTELNAVYTSISTHLQTALGGGGKG
jgi:Flp pilus assembly pilin Flp